VVTKPTLFAHTILSSCNQGATIQVWMIVEDEMEMSGC